MTRLLFILFIVSCGQMLSAQGGFNPANIARNAGRGAAPTNAEVARDTTDIFYFYSENPGQDFLHADTLLESYFLQYDPIRKQRLPYAHLGLPGTAARPLVHKIQPRRGFDIGFHAYDLYKLTPYNLKYYKVEQAYTRGGFSQGLTQQETTFDAEFAREFAGNLTLSFDFKRMSNAGFYENQQTDNLALGVNAWFHSDNNRYSAFASFIINRNDHQENGGIAQLPLNEAFDKDTVDAPILATPFLSSAASAQNRHKENILNFKHFYKLNREKVDGLNRGQRAFTLVHEATLTTSSYKYTDLSPDTAFYKNFVTDERGIRHFLEYQKLENAFSVSTFKTKKDTSELSQQKDLLELGLLHRYNKIEQELDELTVLNEVFATGRWQIAPGERLRLNVYGHLGLLGEGTAGDYRAEGDLSFNLGKGGTLTAFAMQQLTRPNLLQSRFVISQREVYTNDFRKSLSTEVGGSYALPQLGFRGELTYQLLDNQIYFDSLGMPQQTDTPVSVGRITVNQDVKLGAFHLDNQLSLQQTDADFIQIPPFCSRHSLYWVGKIFKKIMDTRVGFDLRLNSPYSPYAYSPINTQFVPQDVQDVDWQPIADFWLAFRVKKLRIGGRFENFLPIINRKDYYYQTANYPVPHGYVRFMLKWQFVD